MNVTFKFKDGMNYTTDLQKIEMDTDLTTVIEIGLKNNDVLTMSDENNTIQRTWKEVKSIELTW